MHLKGVVYLFINRECLKSNCWGGGRDEENINKLGKVRT